MEPTTVQRLSLALLVASCVLQLSKALTIEVYNNSVRLQSWTDDNAAFNSRSINVPVTAIRGQLVFPVPRNICTSVDQVPDNTTLFAFVENYFDCPSTAEDNINSAGYEALIAYSPTGGYLLPRAELALPRVLVTSKTIRDYLVKNAIVNITSLDSTIFVEIFDDSFKKLERLFIIFGSILLAAVVLSITVFCCTICCRLAIHKWRTRGLTRWQVRQLPKRKYRRTKETTETCSICLEEFKEGESIRVLPCDHVFHPKCVDEWLQKWNRTCPLCKSAIKRKAAPRPATLETTTETSPLLTTDNEARSSRTVTTSEEEDGGGATASGTARHTHGSYGAAGYSTPLTLSGTYRRPRDSSDDSSDSHPGFRKTLATVELGGDITTSTRSTSSSSLSLTKSHPSRELSPMSDSVYHTPQQSDQEDGGIESESGVAAASYQTPLDGASSSKSASLTVKT